jgi:hypothetical protein
MRACKRNLPLPFTDTLCHSFQPAKSERITAPVQVQKSVMFNENKINTDSVDSVEYPINNLG